MVFGERPSITREEARSLVRLQTGEIGFALVYIIALVDNVFADPNEFAHTADSLLPRDEGQHEKATDDFVRTLPIAERA